MNDPEIEKLLEILGIPMPPVGTNQKAIDVVLAAVFLSEGMDLTFRVFADRREAVDTIMSCLTRIGKVHGIQFKAEHSMHPLH